MTLSVKWSERGVKDGSSPLGSYGWKGGANQPKTISVQWDDRWLAMRQCVGFSYPAFYGGLRYLRRELPEGSPFDSTLFCTRANIVRGETWTGRNAYDRDTFFPLSGYPSSDPNPDPEGDNNWKANEFKKAILALEFQAADFFIRRDGEIDNVYGGYEIFRYTSYREDRQVKGISLPGGVLFFIDGTPEGESIPFGVPHIEFEKTVYVKWHQVATDAVPWDTIDKMIAKVNRTTFIGLYPPDTLLMLPPKVDRYVMANGLVGCDIEFCYGYTPNLQPKLLHPKTLTYKWVTKNTPTGPEPTPGALPDGAFLFNEAEFLNCYLPNNP